MLSGWGSGGRRGAKGSRTRAPMSLAAGGTTPAGGRARLRTKTETMQAINLYLPIKRLIDLVAGLLVIVLFSPILLIAAVGTKLTSPGPVFFRQVRGGRNKREFCIYKLRTMVADRKPDPKEVVPLDHPDITPFGRILRRTKVDELPQILSVLTGHMSIVGPRPTLPDQVARYDEFQLQRLNLRPGITGLAQVNGNTALSWPERIKYDVYYVRHCSPALDLMILSKTVVVLLLGEARFARPFEQSPYARGGRR